MLAQAINATCSLPVLPLLKVQTNWTVITGVFSSGKTTLVNDLAAARPELSVMSDVARIVIRRGLSWRGPNGEQIGLNDILRTQRFQNTVFAEKWRKHLDADPHQPHLLDYGLPDVLAFSSGSGIATELFESRAGLFQYRRVFVLQPLAYVKDGARDWTEEERSSIFNGIVETYKRLGFDPISVPPLPPAERRDFVLARMDASTSPQG